MTIMVTVLFLFRVPKLARPMLILRIYH